MGNLIYIRGDVLTSDAQIVAHGCNTRGGFSSGVAGQIARLYPEARQAYLNKFNQEGWKLGQVQFVQVDDNLIIANMATQDTYGGNHVHVNYAAVGQCFATLLDFAEAAQLRVAIPKIGAGLAGGDWSKLEVIILDELMTRNVDVRCYTID